jgi:YD repeat-containing protein
VTKRFRQIAVPLLVGLLVMPAVPSADQAQYFYPPSQTESASAGCAQSTGRLHDELGRLVGVVDGSGNAAVYVYDEVGNLLDRSLEGPSQRFWRSRHIRCQGWPRILGASVLGSLSRRAKDGFTGSGVFP